MTAQFDIEMPNGFAGKIHRALRAYHAQHIEDVLDDLLLARQAKSEQERTSPRLVSNQILLNGLDGLGQVDPEAAELLQRRFANRETARQIAYIWNTSEDVIFQRQHRAIDQLAQMIWNQEIALRQEKMQRVQARLEPPGYTRLFGVTEKLAAVRSQLALNSEPWLIAIDGLGGIGKTSLVDALARELAGQTRFHEIGWVSARRRLFHLSGDIEPLPNQPALTLAELVDRLVDQFDLAGLKRRSDAEKLAGLKTCCRSQPCLVIVDNLETAADCQNLVSQLHGLTNPSKFLITTRHALRETSGVCSITLSELSRDDTLALIRHEAKTRGLHELAAALELELEQIYHLTGGNPLATKLVVGQIHTFSLPLALTRFEKAKGKSVEKLLDYIYDNAWQSLEPNSRRVLQAMLLVSKDGGRLEQIAAAAELDPDQAADCLQRLAALSLVNVGGDLQERRYALHQLTQTFLAQKSFKDD